MKYKIIIIGSFPKNDGVVGGIARSCNVLIRSELNKTFDFIKIDSTEMSHGADNIIQKIALSSFRLISFLSILVTQRVNGVLIFHSPGLSLLEKGFLSYIAAIFFVKTAMFPRGGKIISDYESNMLHKFATILAYLPARLILCQEEGWKDFFKGIPFVASKRIVTVRNWTSSDELIQIGFARNANIKSKLRVLFVGSLIKEKGVYDLVDAIQMLDSSKFTLTFVGEGPDRTALEKIVASRGLVNCNFLGVLSQNDIKNIYRDSDVLVLPSWHEGLPNVLIESMATALVTIATKVGMIPDLISDGVNGYLIDKNSPSRIAELLRFLEFDRKRLESISRAGTKTIINKYNPNLQLCILKKELINMCTS